MTIIKPDFNKWDIINTVEQINFLTHLPLVPHICVNESNQVSIGSDNDCRLFGAKPLFEPLLCYYKWDP